MYPIINIYLVRLDYFPDASRNSHEIVVVAVFLGVIIPGATAAVLYFLLKKE